MMVHKILDQASQRCHMNLVKCSDFRTRKSDISSHASSQRIWQSFICEMEHKPLSWLMHRVIRGG
ncbi:hypothetical protein HAX54_008145, partial [Datura stramonium]|nr:hypothetical protein [Datura stramonium]